MSMSFTHKNPTGVLQLSLTSYRTNYSSTLTKLCLIVFNHMIQEHNLGQHFTEALCRNPKSRERAVLELLAEAEATKVSVTRVVAILSYQKMIFPSQFI